jgi:two-component system LytT family response regulator
LILLDIQLGDGSGFDVLERLEQVPEVIFTTAYNQHAVRAFEINALDYLMKPIMEERLNEALERAAKRLARLEKSRVGKLKGAAANRSLMELAGTGRFVAPEDISFIQAEDKYTRVHLRDGGKCLTQTSLADWQRKLEMHGFQRLDRRWLVCLAVIGSVEFVGREALVSIRQPSLSITIGRTAATRLRQVLRASGAWE